MKIVIASDKWRGSFSSAAAGEAIAAGVREALPEADVRVVPLADGGEGTLEVVLAAAGGECRTATVTGPHGGRVEAAWAILEDGRALLESAQAIGLARLGASPRDPLSASSRGLGELVAAAVDAGCARILLALGGTATVDGGAGMASALGARFLDAAGATLAAGGGALLDLERVDLAGLDPRLAAAEIECWCDVASTLLGPRGAARTYGPQKGAGPAEVDRLEAGLARLAEIAERDLGRPVADLPGSGAAGGVGAGAAGFLGARLASGAGRILDLVGFDAILDGADLVITGEGTYDPDAMPGKLPDAVLARAAARGVHGAVLCGDVEEGAAEDPDVRRVPVYSRRDLHDKRGADLRSDDLAGLGQLLVRQELRP